MNEIIEEQLMPSNIRTLNEHPERVKACTLVVIPLTYIKDYLTYMKDDNGDLTYNKNKLRKIGIEVE